MSLIAALALAAPPALPLPAVEYTPPRPRIVTLALGEATCDGKIVAPIHIEPPMPSRAFGETSLPPATLKFRIDADGRPLGIAFDEQRRPPYRTELHDLQPAFAAWRFDKGAPRTACRITFSPRSVDAEDADPSIAYRYAALVTTGRPTFDLSLSRALFARARGRDSNCERRPQPRRMIYPDLDRVPQSLGGVSFVMLNYDVDKSGKPVDVQVIGSNGNADLNRRATAAIQASRFAPEARRGCVYFYYRNPPGPLAPPPVVPQGGNVSASATCPKDESQPWKRLPKLVFPEEFRRRGIEGWAILRYDVAPWGQVGNVSVIAAEPASIFGERAINVLSGALKPESSRGATGCVERVVFRMEKTGEDNAED